MWLCVMQSKEADKPKAVDKSEGLIENVKYVITHRGKLFLRPGAWMGHLSLQ